MVKNDRQSLLITIFLEAVIIMVLIIIKVDLPIRDEGKISVGLIELMEENRKVTPKKQEETREEKPAEKTEAPQEVVEKPVEEKVEEKQQEVVKEVKKPVPEAVPVPDISIDTLISQVPQDRSRPSVSDKPVRQERVFEEERSGEKQEIRGAELEKQEIAKVDTAPIVSTAEPGKISTQAENTAEDGSDFVALAAESDKLEGLPKGYKDVGSPEGNITGKWDESNVMPVYPESAELRGQTGTVTLRVYVREDGRVERVEITEGSGVPELNRSIEEVARTWKIHLSRNGQRVYGNVTLEIPFRLLRGE